MKKLISLVLVFCCMISSASALTVKEFVQRFNADIGQGLPAAKHGQFINDKNNSWILTGYDERNVVILLFDPQSAENPEDCRVTAVGLKHKPRVSVGIFMNNICAALAACFPDIPEEERLAEAMRCLRYRDQVLGLSYLEDDPAPYNTAHMGQFVYQEETNYHTFLFSLPDDVQ